MTDIIGTIEQGATINVNGINYVIEKSKTPEVYEQEGLVNLAAYMRKQGAVAQLYLRRPRGKMYYYTVAFEKRGRYLTNEPVSMG